MAKGFLDELLSHPNVAANPDLQRAAVEGYARNPNALPSSTTTFSNEAGAWLKNAKQTLGEIPVLRWLVPVGAAAGVALFYFSDHGQALLAHWGIGVGAKGKEMVAKYNAVGAEAGELKFTTEAQTVLDTLSQTDRTAFDKLPKAEQVRLLAQRMGIGEADVLAEGKSIAHAKEEVALKGSEIEVNAKGLDLPGIMEKYNIGDPRNGGKTYTQAQQDGTFYRIMRDRQFIRSAADVQSLNQAFQAGMKTESDAGVQRDTIEGTNAQQQLNAFARNFIGGMPGLKQYMPAGSRETPSSSSGPAFGTPAALSNYALGSIFNPSSMGG